MSEKKWSNALNRPWFILVDDEITMMGDDVPEKEELVEIINDAYEKCIRNANKIVMLEKLICRERERARCSVSIGAMEEILESQ